MPEKARDRRTGAWVTEGNEGEGSGVKWLGFGPASGWGGIYVGSGGPAWAGSDVADVLGPPRICPIFGLDMRGVGQPGHLRHSGSYFRDW